MNLMKRFLHNNYLLCLILTIGFFLRIVDINNNPPALYGDELTLVYDSYSILLTGHDQRGNYLPITFPMRGGSPPGYVYASLPFIWLFGPTAMGVRMLSVFSGVGVMILIYLLGKKLFDKRVGVIAAALIALSPWDLNLSRGGFETHFALFLTLLGAITFLNYKTKPWLLVISALSFAAAIFTYPTYKLTVPLILILLVWYTQLYKNIFQQEIKKYAFSAVVLLIFAGFLTIFQTFVANSEGRFEKINAFGIEKLSQELNQKIFKDRQFDQVPQVIKNLLHNRPVEYGSLIGESYLGNFSLDFLFLHGDKNPRHNMSTMGEFYVVEMFFVLLGVIYLIQYKKKNFIMLLFWLLIAPIPAALLLEPHALRSSLMLPPLILFSALGADYFYKILILNKKRWLLLPIIIIFFVNAIIFFDRHYFLAPTKYSNFWAYPAKLASEIAIDNSNKYDYVIISDRLDSVEFAYPVYKQVHPSLVIQQNFQKIPLGRYLFNKYKNVYVGPVPDSDAERFLESLGKSILYIGPDGDQRYLQGYETIAGKDGLTALVLKKINR